MTNKLEPLRTFATDPGKTFNLFKKIDPTHRTERFIQRGYLITAIGIAAVSLGFFRRNFYICSGLLCASGGVLYAGRDVKRVERVEYTNQQKAIGDYFNPLIQVLQSSFEDKANYIRMKVDNQEANTLEEVEQMIGVAAQGYDQSHPDQSQYTRDIETIANFDSSSYAETDPAAITFFDQLKKAAKLYLKGMKVSDSPRENSYVSYTILDLKAVIPSITV